MYGFSKLKKEELSLKEGLRVRMACMSAVTPTPTFKMEGSDNKLIKEVGIGTIALVWPEVLSWRHK